MINWFLEEKFLLPQMENFEKFKITLFLHAEKMNRVYSAFGVLQVF